MTTLIKSYPSKCISCGGTGVDYLQVSNIYTSAVCIVCGGSGVITVTESTNFSYEGSLVLGFDVLKYNSDIAYKQTLDAIIEQSKSLLPIPTECKSCDKKRIENCSTCDISNPQFR